MTGGREVLDLQFRAHSVKHIDITCVEHRSDLGQREPKELLEIAYSGHSWPRRLANRAVHRWPGSYSAGGARVPPNSGASES